jgi:preprotein translocase subunit YajC
MMLAIFIVFYFFMIRPQQQKAKDQKKFIEAIKAGDKVVTLGGMHGKVVSVNDLTVVLEIDRGLKATFDRASINMESSKKLQADEAKA